MRHLLRRALVLAPLAACVSQTEDSVSTADTASPPPPNSLLVNWNTDAEVPPAGACQGADVVYRGGVGFPDLQAALNGVQAYDILWICPGWYVGTYRHGSVGPFEIRSTTGAASDVVLDGAFAGSALSGPTSVHIRLRNVTFQNFIGNIVLAWTGEAELLDSIFRDNEDIITVGGDLGRTLVRGCQFERNHGRCVDYHPSRSLIRHDVHVVDTVFLDNWNGSEASPFTMSSSAGPLNPQNITFRQVDFIGNLSYSNGSALSITNRIDARFGFKDCHFVDNVVSETGSYGGGAISGFGLAGARSTLRIVDSVFDHNIGHGGSAIWWSSGIHAEAKLIRTQLGNNIDLARDPTAASTVLFAGDVRAEFRNVDFGSGPYANTGPDLVECAIDYGANTSGVLDTTYVGPGATCLR